MTRAECQERIYSNAYADFLFEYNGDWEFLKGYYSEDCMQIINERYAAAYVLRDQYPQNVEVFGNAVTYRMTPKCYGLMDITAMEAAGISRVSDSVLYGYDGRGSILCVIDTGIDYRSDVFINEDGTTRIVGIWDQTVAGDRPPKGFLYGTEYTGADINEALLSDAPLLVVPSEDTVGHGTLLASIAAGNERPADGLRGAAYEADILVVKLKEAKSYLKWIFGIDDDKQAYQENDIMAALAYAVSYARNAGKPLSICLGLGTASGSHDGTGPLAQMVDTLSLREQLAISVAAGNEGNARLHVFQDFSQKPVTPAGYGQAHAVPVSTVELHVGKDEQILTMELWGSSPDTYSVGFETPDGAVIDRIPPRFNGNSQIDFAIGGTVLRVFYTLVEAQSGDSLVFIWIKNPLAGLWKLRVYGEGTVTRGFHIWLPLKQFLSPDTYFLQPAPETTITSPADAKNAITVTAYDAANGGIYLEAGRGYTRTGELKPDFAAPGVHVRGVGRRGLIEERAGTSVSAAITAGAACLLFQWSLENASSPLTGIQVRRYLIRSARRDRALAWPNPVWGWGELDLYQVFEDLRRSL